MMRYECKTVAVAGGPGRTAAGDMIDAIFSRHGGGAVCREVTVLTDAEFGRAVERGRASLEALDSSCVLVVNADVEELAGLESEAHPFRVLSAGRAEDADFRVSEIEELGQQGIRFNLTTGEGTIPLRLDLEAAEDAVDAALAAAALAAAGFSWEEIIAGLSHAEPEGPGEL